MNCDIQQTHQTRQSGLHVLYVPRYASKYAQMSPHYQMPTLWDKWAWSSDEQISKNRITK